MIRVSSFNLNNLFDRFNFHSHITESPKVQASYRWRLDENRDVLTPLPDAPTIEDDGTPILYGESPVRIEFSPQGRVIKPKPQKHLDALLFRTDRLNADVLAVQEVENIVALKEFNAMLDAPYQYAVLLEGNDRRFIDVGILSRLPIKSAKSHRWVPDPKDKKKFLFSRDLLAVEIENLERNDVLFTIWVAHLKSKFIDPRITDAAKIKEEQQKNDDKRQRQATAMHNIISEHHNPDDHYVVCGDLNDSPGSVPLEPLLNGEINIVDIFKGGVEVDFERPENEGPRIGNIEDKPANEDWTHRHQVSREPDHFERLDHLLLSPALQGKQASAKIQRRTHWSKEKSGSDHDPIYVDLHISP